LETTLEDPLLEEVELEEVRLESAEREGAQWVDVPRSEALFANDLIEDC
jgi:hypothetical protein